MRIGNPVQAWKQMDKKQKIATVAKTAVGAAAIGAVVAAGVMGKKSDVFATTELRGVKKAGLMFAEGFKAIGNKVVSAFGKIGEIFGNLRASRAAEVAEEVTVEATEGLGEVVTGAAEGLGEFV